MKYLILPLLLLTACARFDSTPISDAPQPQPELIGTLALSASARPLLATYRINTSLQPSYEGMVYQPRTATGPDTLTLPVNPSRDSYSQVNWLTLTLNRPARITVTPVSTRPAWTSGWTDAGGSYWKEFSSRTVALGAPADLEAPYSVSLLEIGGTPSTPPSTPAGQPLPAPNQPCPAWVHDAYTATGPDGKAYPTWHPQIDPRYWCSFGHEHGSRPASGVAVLYGYTAAKNGMPEPHNGFKTYTIANGTARWTFTQHFGTGGLGRACAQFHTLDVAYSASGILKADLHLMGDFGKGEATSGSVSTPITGCAVDQATLVTSGARHINLAGNNGYEPWRADLDKVTLGFQSADLSFDTGDAQTACADVSCTALVRRTGEWGVDHRVTINRQLTLAADALHSDTFYTDPMGMAVVAGTDTGATRQYIQAGLNVAGPVVSPNPSLTCFTVDAWAGLMTCGGQLLSPNKQLENAILNGN